MKSTNQSYPKEKQGMKETTVTAFRKLIWILGVASVFGGYGLLALSILCFILAIFMKDFSVIGSSILLGIIGYAGVPLGRWLKSKSHELSELLWNHGENTPYSGVRLLKKLEQNLEIEKSKINQRQPLLERIAKRSNGREIKVIAQGGAGWETLSDKKLILSLSSDSLYLTDLESIKEHSIAFDQIMDISIGGPGTVTKGGGAVGGGFGVEGFLVGAAAASLINLLTTHTSTQTLVRIATKGEEIFLLVNSLDPDGMRRYLSPAYAKKSIAESDTPHIPENIGVADELNKLNELRRSGTINEDEFALLKGRLLQ